MQQELNIVAQTDGPGMTKLVASALAQCLQPGDVIVLSGDLGAGKTQFVQGIAQGLGVQEVPVSPTFNIVVSYDSGRLPLHHFDLYRLDDLQQLEEIGLREYLESDGVCFVEWAEKFPEAFDARLALSIEKTSESGRLIAACGDEKLIESWKQQFDAARDGRACSGGPEVALAQGDAPSGSSFEEGGSRSGERLLEHRAAGKREVPSSCEGPVVLAFDTANEIVAVAVGQILGSSREVRFVASKEVAAHRASNTTLIPLIDALLHRCGIARSQIACVCVGRGPGSFTGVRIAMAAAKGIASALGVGLVGVSTLDAIAWQAQASGVRGTLLVLADAMRKEIYPVRYALSGNGIKRLSADRVVKVQHFAEELSACGREGGPLGDSASGVFIAGDGLVKYRSLVESFGEVISDKLWEVSGRGLLLALEALWRAGEVSPFDAMRHNPSFALPVYTRLSDAEENERIKLADTAPRNLSSGVQDVRSETQSPGASLDSAHGVGAIQHRAPDGGKGRATMHSAAHMTAPKGNLGIAYRPLAARDVDAVSALEQQTMGSDAWSGALVQDELGRRDRTWWVAEASEGIVGYAGALVVDGDAQILKVATHPRYRRVGIARELLARVSEDARNLGALTCSLEVRASNAGAQAFYTSAGLELVGIRPRYYSDREDAHIMKGSLPEDAHDVAGMVLKHLEGVSAGTVEKPCILAIESSCDETAAAVASGSGQLFSDIVASQIDFHARFGGVVPEIASRKHIEAICGVCEEALVGAHLDWQALDAVAVTYAPGLLGALVVGVAFAKGAAWALDVPFIGVNHLEGHLYANKLGAPDFCPPAVVSLVSGGNTMLVHMKDWGNYETLGATIDDAVGEAFDKVAKALGLGYPGGPAISKMAALGNPCAIEFPRAMLHSHDYRFSLSGLKTAVVNYINKERSAGRKLRVEDICASFQQAVIDVQVAKAKTALLETGAPTFCLGGGVAANPVLRASYEKMCASIGVKLVMPPLFSCGDNAGMIALVALDRYRQGKFFALEADAQAHASLDKPY